MAVAAPRSRPAWKASFRLQGIFMFPSLGFGPCATPSILVSPERKNEE